MAQGHFAASLLSATWNTTPQFDHLDIWEQLIDLNSCTAIYSLDLIMIVPSRCERGRAERVAEHTITVDYRCHITVTAGNQMSDTRRRTTRLVVCPTAGGTARSIDRQWSFIVCLLNCLSNRLLDKPPNASFSIRCRTTHCPL